jgi:hypothetical protein
MTRSVRAKSPHTHRGTVRGRTHGRLAVILPGGPLHLLGHEPAYVEEREHGAV